MDFSTSLLYVPGIGCSDRCLSRYSLVLLYARYPSQDLACGLPFKLIVHLVDLIA